MINFAIVLAALCSASALHYDEARADVAQQGGLHQRAQQQALLQQTQHQLQQLQQQQDLLLEQQQQLLQRQRLHHHRQPPQSRSALPPTQQRGAQLHDQATRHPQPRRAAAPLQLLQQEPAAQLGEAIDEAVPRGYTMHAGMASGAGNLISVTEDTTVLQCADACDQRPSCVGFTMLPDSNICNLKSAVTLTSVSKREQRRRDTYVKEVAASEPEPSQALPPQPGDAAEPAQTGQKLPPRDSSAAELLQPQQEPAQTGQELPPRAASAAELLQPQQAAAPTQEAMGMYSLRLCNAYAWPAPVTMSRVEEPKLMEYPLAYKECHDYLLPLREGDQLQFSSGDVSIGTFSVRGLPEDPRSLLLLIPHRRDEGSAAVVFDSHIFHEGSGAQVAVIDTYRGPEHSTVLVDQPTNEKEELSFNSVVAMTPGKYKLTLADWGLSNARKAGASTQLHVQDTRSYVVLRVGAARSTLGVEAYPEELVVFPAAQTSSATCGAVSAAVLVLLSCLVAP